MCEESFAAAGKYLDPEGLCCSVGRAALSKFVSKFVPVVMLFTVFCEHGIMEPALAGNETLGNASDICVLTSH